jgi:hypothetical protein
MPLKTHGGIKKKPWSRVKGLKARKGVLIEESEFPFSSLVEAPVTTAKRMVNLACVGDPRNFPEDIPNTTTCNMLPEKHPLHDHMNKLLNDFRVLSDAIDDVKFLSTIRKGSLARIQSRLDTFDDTLGQMSEIQAAMPE